MQNAVLIIDDEKGIRYAFSRALEMEGYIVYEAENGEQAFSVINENQIDVILLDMKLPDMTGIEILKKLREQKISTPIIMMTAFGDIELAVEAMQLGADNFRTKPFNVTEMKTCIRRALENAINKSQLESYREEEKQKYSFQNIIGESLAIKKVNELISKIAVSPSTTVLIQGPSGTGKELVARAIHFNSDRANNRFIEVNCTAIPESLLESELFGHEKGSFTDAKKEHKGIFEQANGGTLFLDEIGDMPLPMQAKLLRVLQEKTFKRVGGVKNISVDVRVIASTNVHLDEAVKKNLFREDLFYRLNVIPITLPSLKERGFDAVLIARFYLKHFCTEFKKTFKGFTKGAEAAIQNYSWPGNVRELKNIIERAVLLETCDYIDSKHLNLDGSFNYEDLDEEKVDLPNDTTTDTFIDENNNYTPMKNPNGITIHADSLSIEDVEKSLIERALVENNWNRNLVAKIVGINRTTLYSKIKKYGLEKDIE